jgi:hypothetical protein
VPSVRFALLVLLAGCSSSATAFRPTDPAYRPRAATGQVDVFSYAPPSRPYTEVGVITVKGAARAAVVQQATQKAREVGCDFILARSRGGAGGTELLGSGSAPGDRIGVHPGATIGGEEHRTADAEFTCGVYQRAP